jgi:hypothetical protein
LPDKPLTEEHHNEYWRVQINDLFSWDDHIAMTW